MDVYFAKTKYQKTSGVPTYEEYIHPPISAHTTSFLMKIPKAFVPWNIDAHRKGGGLVALRRKHVELAICRCGLVLAGTYAPIKQETLKQIPVALKVMDKGQITQQHDDVENELRIMSQLQMGGVEAPLSNPYVIRWEYSEDAYNDYIATEFVSNGSFLLYAHKKIRELMVQVSLGFQCCNSRTNHYFFRSSICDSSQ